MTRRGRTPLQTDETILSAALAAFASSGYDATSVRALNAQLGLSHETISQRFGSKAELFRAALRHGFERFVDSVAETLAASPESDGVARLRATVRAFVHATATHPHLGTLLHQQQMPAADRSELIDSVGLSDRILEISRLLDSLHSASLIRDTSVRELWFLVEAAAAPLQFPDLASMFDPVDGPLDTDRHLERMVDFVMRGLCA